MTTYYTGAWTALVTFFQPQKPVDDNKWSDKFMRAETREPNIRTRGRTIYRRVTVVAEVGGAA